MWEEKQETGKRVTHTIVKFKMLRTTLTSFSSPSGGGLGGGQINWERGGLTVVHGGEMGYPMKELVSAEACIWGCMKEVLSFIEGGWSP